MHFSMLHCYLNVISLFTFLNSDERFNFNFVTKFLEKTLFIKSVEMTEFCREKVSAFRTLNI